MDSFIGLALGSYTIQGYLPEGGMADLYRGIHVRLGTSAAIKILKVQFAQNDKHRQELKDEAERVAQLDHHLIIRILDCGFLGDRPYLIMPLAKGSLKEFQGTILPLDRIVTYANQIAEALEYAHNRDIVHRDIKPENLLIGSRGEILLSDFGIATITHSVRVSQQEVIGTPQYMAPEPTNCATSKWKSLSLSEEAKAPQNREADIEEGRKTEEKKAKSTEYQRKRGKTRHRGRQCCSEKSAFPRRETQATTDHMVMRSTGPTKLRNVLVLRKA